MLPFHATPIRYVTLAYCATISLMPSLIRDITLSILMLDTLRHSHADRCHHAATLPDIDASFRRWILFIRIDFASASASPSLPPRHQPC